MSQSMKKTPFVSILPLPLSEPIVDGRTPEPPPPEDLIGKIMADMRMGKPIKRGL